MRKQDKIILWPAYFDSTKTRSEGRRIPKSLGVASPKISEIEEAAKKLRLKYEVVADVGYSKTPWLKTGMILVTKSEPKEQTIKKIAKQLSTVRITAPVKQ
jgi:signal recognition particle subunit SRP19